MFIFRVNSEAMMTTFNIKELQVLIFVFSSLFLFLFFIVVLMVMTRFRRTA